MEDATDSGIAVRYVPLRGYLTGRVVDARRRLVKLDPRGMQLLEPWNGGDLWVIRAFVAGSEVEAMASGREPWLARGFELGPLKFGPRKSEEGKGLQQKNAKLGLGA